MLLPALALVVLAGLSALVAARAPGLVRADAVVSAAARRFTAGHGWWRAAMAGISHSADPVVLRVILAVVLGGLLLARRVRAALFVALVAAAGTGARLGLLHLVARPRPADRLAAAYGFSFPSGHTTSSALVAGAAVVLLGVLFPTGAAGRITAGVLMMWAVLVGLSRIALVVHWPTDVLGGWLLATAVIAGLAPTLGERHHLGS
ncbi:phosphatase PAP2 family protein [Dactylosporangium sp. CA-092794]|uniref:phosphatase PAP2 family protein n=1 Tax=Dactylosporangium sp. CA-092794 TaxID=3239929 RepID=UPI003D8D9BF3